MTMTWQNRAGIELLTPPFRGFQRQLVRTLFALPPGLRERLLFSQSWYCVPLQKVLRRALGGAHSASSRFVAGPMAGTVFNCSTAEKYFWMGSEFEQDLQQRLTITLRPGDVAYDIGGHCGYLALLFSALVGRHGSVYSFEPSPVNLARIQRNVDQNAGSRIFVIGQAVSDREGSAFLNERGSESSLVAAEGAAVGGVCCIPTIRLDDFVYRDGHPEPNFIKLDVEGHAGPALRGARQVLAKARPRIMCELHSLEEESEVHAGVADFGYRCHNFDAGMPYPRRVLFEAS